MKIDVSFLILVFKKTISAFLSLLKINFMKWISSTLKWKNIKNNTKRIYQSYNTYYSTGIKKQIAKYATKLNLIIKENETWKVINIFFSFLYNFQVFNANTFHSSKKIVSETN